MLKTLVMTNRASCVNILDECKKGHFEKTLQHVHSSLKGKITNTIALNILISCCNACVHKKDDISDESLLKLLRSIQPFLKNSREWSETHCSNYIHSMLLVTKFLIYKVLFSVGV